MVENTRRCLGLDYSDFEIILLPDEFLEHDLPETIKVIRTGKVSPPEKRDLGASEAKGEILAFLDSDAFPRKDWLNNAVRHFRDERVGAVGGPAVTPPGSILSEEASGLVYSSFLASGVYIYRYRPGLFREVSDYPSSNFLVRKSLLQEIGGFNTRFWPGEDTVFCQKIVAKNKKIIYDPEVLVYHYRRRMFRPHLKQVVNYALHRGYFVKRFRGNSLRISYFLPSLLVAGIVAGGILIAFFPFLRFPYFGVISLYLLLVVFSALKHKNPRLMFLVSAGIILTHLFYGVYFIRGLLARRLREE